MKIFRSKNMYYILNLIYFIKTLLILNFIIRFRHFILNLIIKIFYFENYWSKLKQIHLNYLEWKIKILPSPLPSGYHDFRLLELFRLASSHFIMNFSYLLFLSYFLLFHHRNTDLISLLYFVINYLIAQHVFNYQRLYVD